MSTNKKPALGRGLSALLENAKTDVTTKKTGVEAPTVNSISLIPLSQIEPNPFQPRTDFDAETLQELTESVAQHGIIQPITVRKLGYDKYQIISGERRYKAAQKAKLIEIPAYIRIANDAAMLELGLIENIQREDLNPIEISVSYKRLIEECNLTQEKLAEKVNKQRSTVTNFLRLLKLPVEIQKSLKSKDISMGHARALLGIENEDKQLAVFAMVLENNLSVRQVEDLARGEKVSTKPLRAQPTPNIISEKDKVILNKIHKSLKNNYSLKRNDNASGTLTFKFNNTEDLEHIISFFE